MALRQKMKTIKFLCICFLFTGAISISSCKKGDDDPAISLRTRKARFVNEWTLVKYEKNGVQQSIDNAKFIYDTYKDGNLKETTEGTLFGTTAVSVRNGTWAFVNDKEDVRISINSNVTTYEIQRLANKELWLKKTDGADSYMMYFDGK